MESRMSTVTLDWDDLDRLPIQGGPYVPDLAALQPLKYVHPAKNGHPAVSSIGRVEGEARPSHLRPRLEPPKQHYMIDLLHLHQSVEGTVSKELIVFKEQSNLDIAQMDKLENEKNEALRKYAEESASRGSWNVLSNVAQYLAAGSSIAVGITLGGWGTLLALSGACGLGYRAIRDTAGWQSVAGWFSKSVENQKKLVQRIEMGFLAVELGTGLAGGMGSFLTGAHSALANAARLDNTRKMIATMQATSSLMTSTSKLGRGFIEKRTVDLQARMRRLDAEAERIRMEMSQQATAARNTIDMAQSICQEMHKAIATSEIQDL
jgi:hypothetical protein